MTSPDDESRSDSVWREIVENYGERPALSSRESPLDDSSLDPEAASEVPLDEASAEHGDLFETFARVDHFQPPTPPPIPPPRTWQRAVAWAGVTVAPLLALIVALTGTYLPPPTGWLLLLWPLAGFIYLVFDMPSDPREPWDDGSRI